MFTHKLTDTEFRLMRRLMNVIDRVHPHVRVKAAEFGSKPGMTVVDYGCGPGRYTIEFARLVGNTGKVYAVDLIEIALRETQQRLDENGLNNVELKLAQGYDSGIPDHCADMVFAIDMFHHVDDPAAFCKEVYRIAKPEGLFILSGGHLRRTTVKARIAETAIWDIAIERKEYIAYKKNVLY